MKKKVSHEFALHVRVGDVVLQINDEGDIRQDERRYPVVEYIGDWCDSPAGEFGARIGFTDGTHTDAVPTDVFQIRR